MDNEANRVSAPTGLGMGRENLLLHMHDAAIQRRLADASAACQSGSDLGKSPTYVRRQQAARRAQHDRSRMARRHHLQTGEVQVVPSVR